MLNFKTFINEDRGNSMHIEVDSSMINNNKETINADFDRLTHAPYKNSIIFYNQLRGTLERFGMLMPPEATKQFLKFENELVFTLGETDLYLYVVYNTQKNSQVDAYTQIVHEDELQQLMDSDDMDDAKEIDDDYDDDMNDYNKNYQKKMDYDSGNTGEY